jgi:hypothetical protein
MITSLSKRIYLPSLKIKKEFKNNWENSLIENWGKVRVKPSLFLLLNS